MVGVKAGGNRMRVGDEVLFYHSNATPPGVAGLARIVKGAYADPFAFEKKSKYYDPKSSRESPRWFMVDVAFVEAFEEVVALDRIRSRPELRDMTLLKRGRLSIQPVTREEYQVIKKMGRRR